MLYWTGHQLRPSASHFNNAFLFTFPTAIVPNLFEQAFATAVEQYDALRTIIKEVDGVPQQQVLPKPPSPLAFVDLSHEPNSAAALILWQQQRVRLSFQPDRCLYDSVLVKLHDTHFVWFFNQHHLITDASSFFLIANNVLRKYACLLRDEHLPQEEKPAFNKYATTEQRRRASSRAEKSRIFWQEKLVNKPEQLRFYGRSRHKKSNQVRRWLHNLG
ncbi:MAG: hypothetical protein GY805_04080, partial [Chloroflexi bacterium]|nr:hypothetical protein [Chloroflexota bacterium]